MPKLPHHHERNAERMDDIASSLDAGLDANTAIGSDRSQLDRGFVAALDQTELDLDDLDRRILGAAEKAGDLPSALRERAESQRFTGQLKRSVMSSLAYPLFLIVFASMIFLLLSSIGQVGSGWTILGFWAPLLIFAGTLYYAFKQARTADNFNARRLPVIGKIINDLGELPYLSAMHSLYRAGIPILDAHDLALKTSPIAYTRANLGVAAHALQKGEDYASAVETAAILDADTLQLVKNGERSGSLEESLKRAMTRRREVLQRRILRAAKTTGFVVYAFAMLVAIYVIFSFYGNLYSGLGRR